MRMGPDVRAHLVRADPKNGPAAYEALRAHVDPETRLWWANEPDAFVLAGPSITGLLAPCPPPVSDVEAIRLKLGARRRITGILELRVVMREPDEALAAVMRELDATFREQGKRLVWPRGPAHFVTLVDERITAHVLHDHVDKPAVAASEFAAWDHCKHIEVPAPVRGLKTYGAVVPALGV